jgi:Rhodopirellula transposase DDE domain/Helix-turn-helix of DDE superfamily endonuclease
VSADAELLGLMGPQLEAGLPLLDERSRRLVLGMVARAAGKGGTGAVARLTGASWQTVAGGVAELESGQVAPPGRVRRPGGGRKTLAQADDGLVGALLALVADSTRGDPGSPLVWTTKSVAKLSGALAAGGHRASPQTCWRLLHEQGFSTQSTARVTEGKRHGDRDAQFGYIAALAAGRLAAGQPVISVDAKKKELAGAYAQAGAEWRPRGDPVAVRSHDFPDAGTGHAIPYGVYDVGANTGFVNVGTDHNTAAFAVESVRRWWQLVGKDACPHAARLLVTCDAGGSNGWRTRAWAAGLADFAQQSGLEVTVCHFPPGTSKWNKIEHRLFSQITLAWRGRPLTSHDVIINTIGAITTTTGLTVTATMDHSAYPTGVITTPARIRQLETTGALTRHDFHGEWNYTLTPATSPAPPPEPAPPQPGRGQDLRDLISALARPELTGMTRDDFGHLADALDLPAAAAREQRLHLTRGGPRRATPRTGRPKLPLTAQLLATILRDRLGLPLHALACLFGVSTDTITPAIKTTRDLLTQQAITITPGPARLTTLASFHDYAATAGITIPDPPDKTANPARST